ncbi:ABC transporter permease [Neorhizobium sp. NCHU2750]|uniref:ABC transporter permease n=1 Tax=Neorhizobium sp. NCHU2750 TaxID=1825976 RepID=UPI000E722ADA
MSYLATHARVVSALVMREMSTRFGAKPGGYLWALLDPVSHIAFLSIIFMAIAHMPPLGTSFPLFFATGYIGFQFYQAMAGYLNSAVSGNKALLSYPNVAPIDTMAARYMLQFATTIIVAVFVLGYIIATARHAVVIDVPPLLEAMFAASLIALGGGFANSVLFTMYPIYEKLFGIVTRPLFLVSGVFYIPDTLPPIAKDVILFNPLAHIVMQFRTGFYPQYRAADYDRFYVWSVAALCIFVGLMLFTTSKARLRDR